MGNSLALTQSALSAPPDLKGVFEIEAFKFNCVSNYEKTTGQKNGEMIFERERILFMKTVGENQKLEQCTRFSIYSAFVELFVSGLTLQDGLTYIIPYKTTAQFQIGWKGRLEQLSQMPEVNFVPEPQIVLTNELADFEYELGESPRIVKHKPAKNRDITKENKIEFVYLILDTKFGKRSFIMSRQEVLQIRDSYSIGYKSYVAKDGKWPDGNKMDPPFWISNEAEAFKKTLVKRVYKYMPKTPRMKLLDEKIKTYIDHEDGTAETTQDIDYGLADDKGMDAARALPAGNNPNIQSNPLQGDNTESKEEIAKAKRSHKKKEPETKAPVEELKTITTEKGEVVDMETAEILSDGPTESDNPVDDLPDLGGLTNY